jgi:hypothetical protein
LARASPRLLEPVSSTALMSISQPNTFSRPFLYLRT